MAAKKSSSKGRAKVKKVMREYKRGELKSGGRAKVKNRRQAIAIALSEAREAGARIPKKGASKKSSSKRGGAKKGASKKSSSRRSASKKSSSRTR